MWINANLLHLSYGNQKSTYRLDGQILDPTAAEKDLGILINNDFKEELQCTEAYKKNQENVRFNQKNISNQEVSE